MHRTQQRARRAHAYGSACCELGWAEYARSGGRAIGYAQLVDHVLEMLADGPWGQPENASDLLVRPSATDERHDLELACRQTATSHRRGTPCGSAAVQLDEVRRQQLEDPDVAVADATALLGS